MATANAESPFDPGPQSRGDRAESRYFGEGRAQYRAGRHRQLPETRPRRSYRTSNSPAAPMPPPTHIVTTTYFAPRRLPSISAWPVQRAPVMP